MARMTLWLPSQVQADATVYELLSAGPGAASLMIAEMTDTADGSARAAQKMVVGTPYTFKRVKVQITAA